MRPWTAEVAEKGSVFRDRRAAQNLRRGAEAMEVAEANLVQLQLVPVTQFPHDDLRADGEQVLLVADGDVVIVRTHEGLLDGKLLRHVVYDLGDAPDAVRGAIDVDHTVIADQSHLCRTGPEREIRVILGD